MHPIWFWIIALASMAALALLAKSARYWYDRRLAQEEAERQKFLELVESEIQSGRRLQDGRLACCVCQTAPATHALPRIGLSVFERLNPLRDLYGSVRLYRRVDNKWDEPVVCETHRDLYAAFLDAELAEIRRLAASFAMSMDRRISDLRSGMLLEATKQYAAAPKSLPGLAIAQTTAPTPLLVAHEELAVSTQQTTNGKRREKDQHSESIHVEATN
jgi:hypothetical protein